ncbi:MAG: PTS fructose transporter subunit IIA [Pseudomonadota bacterium]
MIGIVIVAHGGLASEYLAAMEHVVGKQSGIRALRISADSDRGATQAEICNAIIDVDDGSGVVVVTDLYGSSHAQLCVSACGGPNAHVVYGANLPLLLKLAKSRAKPIADAVHGAVQAGRKYIDSVPRAH